jgi:histidine triad (HIT) family protein
MYNPDNIFAKIINKEITAKILYEDEDVVAIEDIAPIAPVHILVLTKKSYISFDDFILREEALAVDRLFKVVQKIAADNGLAQDGYRILMNHGYNANQSVPHFHIHILGGKKLGTLLGK